MCGRQHEERLVLKAGDAYGRHIWNAARRAVAIAIERGKSSGCGVFGEIGDRDLYGTILELRLIRH